MADANAATLAAMRQMIEALSTALANQGGGALQAAGPPRDDGIEKFSGDRAELPVFLGKIEWLFESHAAYFDSDAKKIAYVVNRLDGVPAKTIIAIKTRDGPADPIVTSYARLREYLRANYGDVNEKLTAETNIYALRQTSSASDYFARFRQYVAVLGWTDSPQLVSQAKQGLKPEVKDKLAREARQFTSLAEFTEVAVSIDNRLWERREEKKKEEDVKKKIREEIAKSLSGGGGSKKGGGSSSKSPAGDATEGKVEPEVPPRPPRSTRRDCPVPQEETERRMRAGVCIKCGQAGHIVRNCPHAEWIPAASGNVADVKPTLHAVASENEEGLSM